MAEHFILPTGFPSIEQLQEETYNAIKDNGGVATNKEIKEYIIGKLKLSDEVVSFENSDGLTTLLDYRLRWARTALKGSFKSKNVERGVWRICEEDYLK